MAGRWKVISCTADSKKTASRKTSYTRSEVEQMLRKAARAAGVGTSTIEPCLLEITPSKQKPVAKSSAQIEAERRTSRVKFEGDLERQRAERIAKMTEGGDRLSRMLARDVDPGRTAVTFEQPDGREASYAGDAVTRLDLAQQPLTKRHGLFGPIVDASTTEPYKG